MSDAALSKDVPDIQMIAQASFAAGKIWQLRDGRAGYFKGLNAAAVTDQVKFGPQDQITVPKNTGYALLDGGPVYWDRTNSLATFKRLGANRGFFLGSAVGDAPSAATSVLVANNVKPVYDLDLAQMPYTTTVIGTQAAGGLGAPGLRGGALDFLLTNTNQAQKVDALSVDGILTGSKGIVRTAIRVLDGGAATNAKFYLGLASASHATDPTAVTEYVYFEIDSNVTKINAQSADGTHSTPKTDTTKTYTVGTRVELWIDIRNPALTTLYVDGVQVLAATTFDLSAGAQNLFLLAWLGKVASTDTMEVAVDWANTQTAEQSINGV